MITKGKVFHSTTKDVKSMVNNSESNQEKGSCASDEAKSDVDKIFTPKHHPGESAAKRENIEHKEKRCENFRAVPAAHHDERVE